VDLLIGDARKVRDVLGWASQTSLESLCRMMVDADLRRNEHGFSF
jgi:GDPmannose 4,6-dehydratase